MFWKDTRNHHIPHMMMTLKGRLKGENNLWWHCVLFEDQTKIWIPTRKWVIRIIYSQCKLENYERGLLLSRDNGRHASIGYYDPMFRIFSEWGQNLQPKLFTTRVFIGDFSLIIIPRSGANMEADFFWKLWLSNWSIRRGRRRKGEGNIRVYLCGRCTRRCI